MGKPPLLTFMLLGLAVFGELPILDFKRSIIFVTCLALPRDLFGIL